MEQYQRNWKNYYEILQLSPNAESEVISSAYRRLAQKYHPDISRDKDSSEQMADLNEAYEVLSNPTRRTAYDSIFREKHHSQTQSSFKTDFSSKKKDIPETPIHKQAERTIICNNIIKLLANQPGLKAKQIAEILKIEKVQVNSMLYNELCDEVNKDNKYRWWLKDASGQKKEAVRPAPARQSKSEVREEAYKFARDGFFMLLAGGVVIVVIYAVFGVWIGWFSLIFLLVGLVYLITGVYKSFRS